MRIVELLAEEDRSVSDLVAQFSISQPAVSATCACCVKQVSSPRTSGKQRIYGSRPRRLRT